MTKSLTKVIYRPDHTSTSEYMVIVNPEEVRRHSPPTLITSLNNYRNPVQEMERRRWACHLRSLAISIPDYFCFLDTYERLVLTSETNLTQSFSQNYPTGWSCRLCVFFLPRGSSLITLFTAFSVFHSSQGRSGFLGQASQQQLDADFGTVKNDEVVKEILTKGRDQASDSIGSLSSGTTNMARGRGSVDLKGKGPTNF